MYYVPGFFLRKQFKLSINIYYFAATIYRSNAFPFHLRFVIRLRSASLLIEDDWRVVIVENKQFGDADFGGVLMWKLWKLVEGRGHV
jgi:hypothetical protein